MSYADVILPLPLDGTFTYALPEAFAQKVKEGCRLTVPFGAKKRYSAIVSRIHDQRPEGYEVKEALELLDDAPILLPGQLRLWQWIADYYLSSVGMVYKAALPSGLKEEDEQTSYRPKMNSYVQLTDAYAQQQALMDVFVELKRSPKQAALLMKYIEVSKVVASINLGNPSLKLEVEKGELLKAADAHSSILQALVERGILEIYEKQVLRLEHDEIPTQVLLRPLSPAQQQAFDAILAAFQQQNICLLHGVTSSGKTEVYIHLIQQTIERGKQVLYLLPEIVLTTQLVNRLKRVFGGRLGVYHSKYSDAERVEVWQKQLSQEPYDIIVGVRSSVFLPFQRLGLVIVDEEHEQSFKQQDPTPRYHGRNVALVLAQMSGAKTLLGTATPSLETYYNCQVGKYALVELFERYQQVTLPHIEVVNLAEQRRRKLMSGPFSDPLVVAIREALSQGEQVILFQNRRGYSPNVECHQCGWVPRCPHCDVSLTHHKRLNQMTCHYCGYTIPIALKCPNCEGMQLDSIGFGTERIEDVIRRLFPEARVARMDLDTTRSRSSYEKILSDFQHGKTDILVGTQMVTKGLDFERVSVVGILNADTMLNMPDFRAYEHAFQMMEQVAGRAGRSGKQGRVVLQTKTPVLPVVDMVARHDYLSLYQTQMEERQAFRYPPLTRLIYVYMKHRYESVLNGLAYDMSATLRAVFGDRVLGPDTPPIARIQNLYIRKIVLKIELAAPIPEVRARLRQVAQYYASQPQFKSATVYFDVDPV
ncbi:MAG: primosomal protein N' [Bacteroidales bacterium]|nr:primosomal protein N' [Candidatus Physcousia equi]